MRRLASVFLLALIAPFSVVSAVATLPEAERSNFSVSRDVITSLDAMVSRLQAAEKNSPSSRQIGLALGNCKKVRRTIAHWPHVAAYHSHGAERLWKECESTYDAVR
jgi:hypothetical protein